MANDEGYCRVSTDNQEREGTSLESQAAAILAFNQARGIKDTKITLETYSGLTTDRPEYSRLRQRILDGEVSSLTCYCPDRLSRIGEHILEIMQLCNDAAVKLRFVLEDWSTFDPATAKLMAFIYGWSSEQEAKKILERTTRGKRARAMSGKLPSGGYCHYGYTYIRSTGKYIINEHEAEIVRRMFNWLINDHLSIRAIVLKLTNLGIPAPKGGLWGRSTIARILNNTQYYGCAYTYKTSGSRGKKRVTLDRSKWIELPDAIPPIITKETFDQAQRQLQQNRHSGPARKNDYLLTGLIYCKKCGRRYHGVPTHGRRYYRCASHADTISNYCHNRTVNADNLEGDIWTWIQENALSNPKDFISRIAAKLAGGDQLRHWQAEIDIKNERILRIRKQVDQAFRLFALIEDTTDQQTRDAAARINKMKAEIPPIEREIEILQQRINENKQALLDMSRLEEYIRSLNDLVQSDQFKDKHRRMICDALRVRVAVGDPIEVEIDVLKQSVSCPITRSCYGQLTDCLPVSFTL